MNTHVVDVDLGIHGDGSVVAVACRGNIDTVYYDFWLAFVVIDERSRGVAHSADGSDGEPIFLIDHNSRYGNQGLGPDGVVEGRDS